MERLGEKWHSRRGASILMALLFQLICILVAASVLMAAVSNAGKTRSAREEQQRYLTLSSAVQLVCDELCKAQYVGKYTYVYTPEVKDEEGNVMQPEWHTYTQKDGEFSCGLNALPLLENLDALFASTFPTSSGNTTYNPKNLSPPSPHTLTLTVEDDTGDYPGLGSQPVEITVELRDTGMIYLSAKLEAGGLTYTMKAELRPNNSPEKLFALKAIQGENKTDAMTWTLGQITKGTD